MRNDALNAQWKHTNKRRNKKTTTSSLIKCFGFFWLVLWLPLCDAIAMMLQ